MTGTKLIPPFAALRAFEAVGRLNGVRSASRELNIDHAVVSRHLRSLEAWVGRPLLVRGHAGYHLTPEGRIYHDEVSQALGIILVATNALMHGRLKFRLYCIPGFASLWLSDRLNDFISANPDIELGFKPTDQAANFRAREADADIRYLRQWEEAGVALGLQRLEFARPAVFPVASPGFVAAMKPLRSAADLLNHTLIHEENDREWHHWLKAQDVHCDNPLSGPHLWHAHLTLNAARQGHGIALANTMLLGSDIEEGRLQILRPIEGAFNQVRFGGYTLFARSETWNMTALRRFRQWLFKAADRFEKLENGETPRDLEVA